jgi:lipopolysaccharide export system protein LptA
MPLMLRGLAIAGMVLTILVIGIGFYWGSFRSEFRMKGFPTKLSKDVIGNVNGYERRESDTGILKYFIKADNAITFSDNHQELQNVFVQLFYDGDENVFDRISSDKAIYIPADDGSKNFKIYFAGGVDIATRDSLNIRTDQLTFNNLTEIADAEEQIQFERENVTGKSFGAIVNIGKKTLELLRDVEIIAIGGGLESNRAGSNIQRTEIRAGSAYLDQLAEKITLERDVGISLIPRDSSNGSLKQPTDISANRATVAFRDKDVRKLDLDGNVNVHQKPTPSNRGWTNAKSEKATAWVENGLERLELHQNVNIESSGDGSMQTRMLSGSAIFIRSSDTLELRESVEIITGNGSQITKLTASEAVYEQSKGNVNLSGGARVEQGANLIRGLTISAQLYPTKKVKYAVAKVNAYLKQVTADRVTEISARELNASFGPSEFISKANALGNGRVEVIPSKSTDYTKFTMTAPVAINLDFEGQGSLRTLVTKGRTAVKLNVPKGSIEAADKTLRADSIKTNFRKNGNEIAKAAGIGNGELVITPHRSSPKNYKTTINAPRFDCEFFSGNNAKYCWSTGRSKVRRESTLSDSKLQMLVASRLNVAFERKTGDVKNYEANGEAEFSEGDRKGNADRIEYNVGDGLIRLRGGIPTVWDSKARTRANEIDWDTVSNKSVFRAKVRTAYYRQKKTKGSTPFLKANSPVYITANTAALDHKAETALYTGNARAWQGNNFVRAERLFLQQMQGRFFAEGKVQSLVFDSNRTVGGRKTKTPVYVSANEMRYSSDSDLIRYEKDVDIRQGKDRIQAETAEIYLDKRNELSRSVFKNSVVITEPKRRSSGSYAEFDSVSEVIILRGNPAKVRDIVYGSSEGREMTIFLKENRFVGSGKTKRNSAGRSRTVYKITKGKLN